MRTINIHRNPVIPMDERIESQKDFEAVIKGVDGASSNHLTWIWAAAFGLSILTVIFLGSQVSMEQKDLPEGESAAIVAPVVENIESEEGPAEAPQEENIIPEAKVNTRVGKLPIGEKRDEILASGYEVYEMPLEPIPAPQLKPIEQRVELVKDKAPKFPEKLSIDTDLFTFAELKSAESYYIEIDTAASANYVEILSRAWVEAKLTPLPRKNRFLLKLKNGSMQADLIVRLVTDSGIKSKRSKFSLKDLFKR